MSKEPSHLEGQGYGVCALDWAGPKGVFWTIDGKEVRHSLNLMEMLEDDELQLGLFRIVLEPMFESFGTRGARDRFVEECAGRGHVLQKVQSRMTYRIRERRHFELGHVDENVGDCKESECAKTDEADVLRIWELAWTVHCSEVRLNGSVEEQEFKERAERLNREAMILRKSGLKEKLMDSIVEAIPPNSLPVELLDSLTVGKGKQRKYRSGVPSIWLAAREASGRDEFERFLGLHGNGMSCQLRSDVYFWMWRLIRTSEEKAGRGGKEELRLRRSKFRRDVRAFRTLLLENPPKVLGLEDL